MENLTCRNDPHFTRYEVRVGNTTIPRPECNLFYFFTQENFKKHDFLEANLAKNTKAF